MTDRLLPTDKIAAGDLSPDDQAAHDEITVRPIGPADAAAFVDLVAALADYEHLPPPDDGARRRLSTDALANPPRFRVLIASRAGQAIGYALYFETYSTFLARPTFFLEDLFVLAAERGRGAGRTLLRAVAEEALRLGCGRLEWQVLTWNEPAIAFYERLGARRLEDWHGYRLVGQEIARLAERQPSVVSHRFSSPLLGVAELRD